MNVVSESVCNITCNLYCFCCISIFLAYANLLHFFCMINSDFCNLFLIFFDKNKSTCTNALCIKCRRGKRVGSLSFLILTRNFNLNKLLCRFICVMESLMRTCKSCFDELQQVVLGRCQSRSFLYDVTKRQTQTFLCLTKYIYLLKCYRYIIYRFACFICLPTL